MELTNSPAPEFEDENRANLIQKLSQSVPHVDSVTWAMLWLANVDKLQYLVALDEGVLWSTLTSRHAQAVLRWAGRARAREDPEKPASVLQKRKTQEPTPRRSDVMRAMCIERDEFCAITQKDEPLEVVHIYPYSMMTLPDRERSDFWARLQTFWPAAKIKQWKQVVDGPRGTEVLGNMLRLSRDAHGLWGMARFALQPVELSADKKCLTMRFFWLPSAQFQESVATNTRPLIPSNLKQVLKRTKHINCESGDQICSGDIIRMETNNPETLPLPSLEILELQWVMTRVLSMSGAADIDPAELEDDSDDDPGIGEECRVDTPTGTIPGKAIWDP